MEDIEKELEEKSIERSVDVFDNGVLIIDKEEEPAPEPELVIEPVDEIKEETPKQVEVVKKSKKVRSQKQIEAFEKARKKRAEILAEKKKNKEAEKEQKKEEKKALKKAGATAPAPLDTRDVDLIKPMSQGAPPAPNPDKGRDQVIQNHYYYYGVPPPSDHHATPKRKKKKSKRPPTPSSSESESSDEEELPQHRGREQQQQQYYEVPKPQYKFSYA